MTRRKICIFSGTRADFGLLRPLISDIQNDDVLELQLIVTGSHLLAEFGFSYREIEEAGIPIARKIEILDSIDTPAAIAKAAGLGMIAFGQALDELKPDMTIVLGDRYEALAAAFSSLVLGIPVAHLHGGEITEGAIDDSIRHAITKIASLHFVAAESYRDRVLQMGENSSRVFLVGGLGVDAMLRLPILQKAEVEHRLGFAIDDRTVLTTYHPATAGDEDSGKECDELLAALDARKNLRMIFTAANADSGGREINAKIEAFVAHHSEQSIYRASLGSQLYFSCLKYVKAVIGNSSSGLLEAPSFQVGTVNIGTRQKGRLRSASVIDCGSDRASIGAAIDRLFGRKFQDALATAINPYGAGGAAGKIVDVLKHCELGDLRRKSFRDWPLARDGHQGTHQC